VLHPVCCGLDVHKYMVVLKDVSVHHDA
jgi:hypothetical protein